MAFLGGYVSSQEGIQIEGPLVFPMGFLIYDSLIPRYHKPNQIPRVNPLLSLDPPSFNTPLYSITVDLKNPKHCGGTTVSKQGRANTLAAPAIAIWKGNNPQSGRLINHLQVMGWSSKWRAGLLLFVSKPVLHI